MSDYTEVQKKIELARLQAEQLRVDVSIAMVDAGGHLCGFLRMGSASFMTVEIAIGKAWTSAAFRAPSAAIEKNMAAAPAFASAVAVTMNGRFMPRQGGLVDSVAGIAVGVSGGTAEQDEEIARAALAESA